MHNCEKCGDKLTYYQLWNWSPVYLVCYECDECQECGHVIGHYHTCSHATAEDKELPEGQYGQLARFILH
jgi:hypothetical protein